MNQTRTRRTLKGIVCAAVLAFLFTGCTTAGNAPPDAAQYQPEKKIVIDTATLQVVTEGLKTTVYDLVSGEEYNYSIVFKKPENKRTAPEEATETETIKIVLLPDCAMEITDYTAGKVYTLTRGQPDEAEQ